MNTENKFPDALYMEITRKSVKTNGKLAVIVAANMLFGEVKNFPIKNGRISFGFPSGRLRLNLLQCEIDHVSRLGLGRQLVGPHSMELTESHKASESKDLETSSGTAIGVAASPTAKLTSKRKKTASESTEVVQKFTQQHFYIQPGGGCTTPYWDLRSSNGTTHLTGAFRDVIGRIVDIKPGAQLDAHFKPDRVHITEVEGVFDNWVILKRKIAKAAIAKILKEKIGEYASRISSELKEYP